MRQLVATAAAATDGAELGRIVTRVALGDLASLPMTATLPTAVLTTAVGALAAEPAEVDGRPRLDRTWLELVAAVRPPLARIEAHQAHAVMSGRPPLSAATSHPGDPWLEASPLRPRATTIRGSWSPTARTSESEAARSRSA